MKILFVTSTLARGGAEKQLLLWIRELARREHQVTLVSSNGPLRAVWQILHICRHWRPEVAVGLVDNGNLFSRLAAPWGIPVVNLERSSDYALSWARKASLRWTRRWVHALAANSQWGALFAAKQFGFPPEPVQVIPKAVEISEMALAGQTEARTHTHVFYSGQDLRIATLVANRWESKDLLFAVDVAEQLVERDGRFRILLVGREGGAHRTPIKSACGRGFGKVATPTTSCPWVSAAMLD